MNVNEIMEKMLKQKDSTGIGMIASHLGIVRGSSRGGGDVARIRVEYDMDKISIIRKDIKGLPGIHEIIIETNQGLLEVGEEIMFVAVGGDIRENVFPALIQAVDRIKKEASRKQEFFT